MDATFEISGSVARTVPKPGLIQPEEILSFVEPTEDFCLAQLKRLMGLLDKEFPREG